MFYFLSVLVLVLVYILFIRFGFVCDLLFIVILGYLLFHVSVKKERKRDR